MPTLTEAQTLNYLTAATKDVDIPVVEATRIFPGALVGRHYCTGLLKPYETGDVFVGILTAEADNSSGAASAITGNVATDGVIEFTLADAAASDIGDPVYADGSTGIKRYGHTLGYVGRIMSKTEATRVAVQLKAPGELPRRGEKSCCYVEASGPPAQTTGAASAVQYSDGVIYSGTLGLGVSHEAIDGKHTWQLELDVTDEVANAQILTPAVFNPSGGIVFETDLTIVSSTLGTSASIDVDWGIGDVVVVTDVNPAVFARFHWDSGSENVLAGSDDGTIDIAETDTTIDNLTAVTKKYTIILRESGPPEFYINRARVLTTTFDTVVLMQALATPYIAFLNLEKVTGTGIAVVQVTRFACYGAGTA